MNFDYDVVWTARNWIEVRYSKKSFTNYYSITRGLNKTPKKLLNLPKRVFLDIQKPSKNEDLNNSLNPPKSLIVMAPNRIVWHTTGHRSMNYQKLRALFLLVSIDKTTPNQLPDSPRFLPLALQFFFSTVPSSSHPFINT